MLAMLICVQAMQFMRLLPADAATSPDVALRSSDTYASSSSSSTLNPQAREVAILLGILPKVERLMELKRARVSQGAEGMSDEELALKVDVLDRVLDGTLEVRMVSDRIDRELSWSFTGQGMLQAKRQKILNYLFTLNFVQGGTLGIISGPLFLHHLNIAGTEMLLLASSIGLGLSAISLLQMRSGHKSIDGETTVLANVFQLPQPEPPHRLDTVVKFMTSVPPESKDNKTRIESLVEEWKRGHYLRSTDPAHLKKLAAVQPEAQEFRENIRLISERIRMLFDTQWTVQQLDGEMLELMRAIDAS
jgi:hypothetical protein